MSSPGWSGAIWLEAMPNRNSPRQTYCPDRDFPVVRNEGVIPGSGCPLLVNPVPAGFPSPATDYFETRISLDGYLIDDQDATYFVRVQGNSMLNFGIHNGDLLVVEKVANPLDRSIVIAVVDGEFSVKQLCQTSNGVLLRSGHPRHSDILVSEGQELTVWGVVRHSIHTL